MRAPENSSGLGHHKQCRNNAAEEAHRTLYGCRDDINASARLRLSATVSLT